MITSKQQTTYLDPTTLVLAQELEWVALGDLAEGDSVWAFDVMPKGQARRTLLTRVESLQWGRRPAFAVTTQSGWTTVASKEQRFLSYSGGRTLNWRRLETLFRPYGNDKRAALAFWVHPWQPQRTFDAGWLAGMFDGEGHITKRKRNGSALVMAITQNAGPLLERVKELLAAAGFDYNCYAQNGKKRTFNLGLKGGAREFMRFLGSYRPGRLLRKLVESNCDLELWLTPDPIVDITAVGMKDMAEIRTAEGTYFANGFAASDSTSPILIRRSRRAARSQSAPGSSND